MKKAGNLDLMGLGEIQNAKLQGLAEAPSSPAEAQFWYDSVNHQPMFYNGSAVKKFGKEYASGTGVTVNNSNDTIAIDTSVVALKSDLTNIFNPAGTLASASDLPTLSSSVLGNIYRVTTSFETTSDFVEGSGKTIAVGNDVVVINVGTSADPSYKFNVWGDFIDLSDYALASAIPTKLSDLTDDLMTGYSKPSSASAVSASDSVKAAIGKLEKALDGKQASGTYCTKYTTNNIALTASNGVVTWTVTHNLGGDVQVQIFEVSTGKMVVPNEVTLTSNNVVTIEMLASANVAADTYKVVVIG